MIYILILFQGFTKLFDSIEVSEKQKRNVLPEEAKCLAGTQSSEYRNRSARYVTWAIIGVNALLFGRLAE